MAVSNPCMAWPILLFPSIEATRTVEVAELTAVIDLICIWSAVRTQWVCRYGQLFEAGVRFALCRVH